MKYCLLSYSFYPNQVGNFVAASRNSDFPGYLPSGSQGRKRDDLCSVLGRSRAFASPYLSSRFRSHVYFASSVSTQVIQFISVDFFQFFRSLLIQVFFFSYLKYNYRSPSVRSLTSLSLLRLRKISLT